MIDQEPPLPFYTEQDVAACLDMRDAIYPIGASCKYISEASEMFRLPIDETEQGVSALMIGGHIPQLEAISFKLVGSFQGHETGIMLLFNAQTGKLQGIVSGSYLTDFRTGAVSGAATALLSRPDSKKLSIIGTGRQALTQLEGISAVRELAELRIWNRTPANAHAWLNKARSLIDRRGLSVTMAASPEEACAGADIVVVSTSARAPVLRSAEALAPGTHVNAVGSGSPEQRELGLDLLRGVDRIVVDSIKDVVKVGDFAGPIRQGAIAVSDLIELSEVFANPRSGRTSEDQITLAKTVGHPANDIVAMQMLVDAGVDRKSVRR